MIKGKLEQLVVGWGVEIHLRAVSTQMSHRSLNCNISKTTNLFLKWAPAILVSGHICTVHQPVQARNFRAILDFIFLISLLHLNTISCEF